MTLESDIVSLAYGLNGWGVPSLCYVYGPGLYEYLSMYQQE
jgi:hypothetical protein